MIRGWEGWLCGIVICFQFFLVISFVLEIKVGYVVCREDCPTTNRIIELIRQLTVWAFMPVSHPCVLLFDNNMKLLFVNRFVLHKLQETRPGGELD